MTELRALALFASPCPLCVRPARWLLWSSYLTEPALVCEEHAKNATAIDVEVVPQEKGGQE